MPKKAYKFNPQTLAYEVIAAPFRIRLYRLLRKILIGFILASLINFIFSYFFYTPKMARIDRDNSELIMKYGMLQDKIDASIRRITEIRQRDNNVYRMLFGVDTLAIEGVYGKYPESKYAEFDDDRFSPIMMHAWLGLDALGKEIYQESVSFDQLQLMSADKETMASSIPAIWPIDKRKLHGNHIGQFGMRNHPIYGRFRMHQGIDLGADRGTEVYATGDGTVDLNHNLSGYGLQILVDHGFGYQTRYAHLSKILVEPGQKVKRGELIGLVGSTGTSTSPHLHYEVIYRGLHVNPINYFRRDMSEEEFERIIEAARPTTFEE